MKPTPLPRPGARSHPPRAPPRWWARGCSRPDDVDVAAHRGDLKPDQRPLIADRCVADLELRGDVAARRARVDLEPRALADTDADVARRGRELDVAFLQGVDSLVPRRRPDPKV